MRQKLSVLFLTALLAAACNGGSGDASPNRVFKSSEVSLADIWNGDARFVMLDKSEFGSKFKMHFVSGWWNGADLYSYFVMSDVQGTPSDTATVGLALSQDALTFDLVGEVLGRGRPESWAIDVVDGVEHEIGGVSADCQGWFADSAQSGLLVHWQIPRYSDDSDYTLDLLLSAYGNLSDETPLLSVEIIDVETGLLSGVRQVLRSEVGDQGELRHFDVPYTYGAEQNLALRIVTYPENSLCLSSLSVHPEHLPYRDARIASFPSVWKDGSTWYLAYEGASYVDTGVYGELRLATSEDGYSWHKRGVPLARPEQLWESVNVGTPTLLKEGSNWYVYYHGYDGQLVSVGLLVGEDLSDMHRVNGGLPVLVPGDGWDSGTIGRRSIIKQDGVFYMAYEGSTQAHARHGFGGSWWGIGLARSTDLVHWEKYVNNPILKNDKIGFGYDGPEFIVAPDGQLHIYFRNPEGNTSRATLVP